MEARKDLSCFVIEGAEREDEGNYTICVTNPAGEDKAMLFVKIVGEWRSEYNASMILKFSDGRTNCNLKLDVPDPPENVRCESVGEDCASILWDVPVFDGGAPLKGKGWILS